MSYEGGSLHKLQGLMEVFSADQYMILDVNNVTIQQEIDTIIHILRNKPNLIALSVSRDEPPFVTKTFLLRELGRLGQQ